MFDFCCLKCKKCKLAPLFFLLGINLHNLPCYFSFGEGGAVISVIVSFPEKSYFEYTLMPSPIYQHVINLVIFFHIRRGPRLFINISAQEHSCSSQLSFFYEGKFTILTPLSLLNWCRLSLPIFGLKISSLPSFALKSPNRIFVWCLGKVIENQL